MLISSTIVILEESYPPQKNNKSPGVDEILPKLLLEIVEQISIALATLFNFVIRGGSSSVRMERSKHHTII